MIGFAQRDIAHAEQLVLRLRSLIAASRRLPFSRPEQRRLYVKIRANGASREAAIAAVLTA